MGSFATNNQNANDAVQAVDVFLGTEFDDADSQGQFDENIFGEFTDEADFSSPQSLANDVDVDADAGNREQLKTQQIRMQVEQELKQKWDGKLMHISKLIDSLSSPLGEFSEKAEKQLIELVMKISQQLYRHAVTIKPELIQKIVNEAMNLLPSQQKNVKLLVSPNDFELINSALNTSHRKEQIEVIEDANLQQGDFQIKSETSQIDGTVEERLQHIMDQVLNNEES